MRQLLSYRKAVKVLKIILASASPRRRELLQQIGLQFEVNPASGEELITETDPVLVVEELSRQKAMEIAGKVKEDGIIIGADTIVTFKNKIMGKPRDEEDAIEMLSQLSGKSHEVYTGVTAIKIENEASEIITFSESTEVVFYPVDKEEICAYISTKEPMDKAGAYGIQGKGAAFVKEIHGDYNNVVGLPLARLYQEVLKKWIK